MLTTTFTFKGMTTTSDVASVGPAADSEYLQERAYSQCVDLVNVDVDTDYNAVRREGSTLLSAAAATSGWGNGSIAYCVVSGLLFSFDGLDLALVGSSPSLQAGVEFCQVNDITVFSDGNTIGYIEDGTAAVINYTPGGIDPATLAARVAANYPIAGDTSNMEDDVFLMPSFAGRCLEFFNGALYLAVGNYVYCTKTFDVEHMDVRYNVVAGYDSNITMIKAVNDGLFIGTETDVFFLAGNTNYVKDESAISIIRGFTQRKVLPFGAVYGSASKISAAKVTALKAANTAVLWLTPDGIYAGVDGGRVADLTNTQMVMPATSSAAALIRFQGTAWQYLACPNTGDFTGGALPSALKSTVVLNLDDSLHSRYTNYAFNSMFKLGAQYFGTNTLGIFLLEGDTDYLGLLSLNIDTPMLTPAVDFGVKELKRCADVYLHVRAAGGMVLDLIVDGTAIATSIPFEAPTPADNKVRRLRAKLPRGVKGTNWQFRIANVAGARFTAFSLKAMPVVSQRTIGG